MLVIDVTPNLQRKVVLNYTLSQSIKVSGMLVISVNTKLQGKVVSKYISSQYIMVYTS